ncbi:MAG: uroporphyrinogen decarboxylase [Oscillospiraceae bacterium]|nr:uroporphyrinogen decarboxylase [Oscillospiraceae bacterium]
MLTAKENMREVIRGGNPDRVVNQYEAIQLLLHPFMMFSAPMLVKGGPDQVDAWGVTNSFPENVPGQFPVHTPDKIVLKDIEHWRDYVKAPSLDFTPEQWAICKGMYDAVDGTKAYKAVLVVSGLFERCHHLMSIEEALMAFYEYPDEMHELIEFLTEWELELAKGICENLHPDAVFHHDDWGSELNSFLSPAMFKEFFLEPYKRIYKYYKDHGCEIVIHHADSYCANLIEFMIEMGIDVFQGAMRSNNNPELIAKYGDKITIMGEIDNKQVDFQGWTDEDCKKAALTAIERCGTKHFIPCITQGGPGSTVSGTYMSLIKAIDEYNAEKLGCTVEEIAAQRCDLQIMFG